MKIKYKYSLKEEFKNLIDLIKNNKDYKKNKNLYVRSLNLWSCLDLKLHENVVRFIIRITLHKRPSIEKTLKKLGIENDLKIVTCYLHAFGVGGWFDIDKKEIHVRWDYHINHFVETLIHEILHLLTYKENYDYSKREEVVEKYMQTPEIQKIVNQ